MILSPQQLNELLAIVDNYTILFVAHNVGTTVLSEQDRAILQISGVDISKIESSSSKITEAYRFGMLSQILQDSALKNLTYPQLKSSIAKFAPLTSLERSALQSLQFQTYQDVKKLGQSIKSQVTDTFVVADKKRHTVQHTKLVTDAAKKAIEDRKYLSEVVSILGKKTGDWERDLGRIGDFVLHTAFDEGRIAQIQKEEGDDALVYKDVYQGACQHCQRLFLTGGVSSEPIIFTVAQLKANGTNIGFKVAEWRPVIGPIHPWCRCTIERVPKGFTIQDRFQGIWEWDGTMFIKNWEKLKELNRPKVERHSKVRVTVNDKTTEV